MGKHTVWAGEALDKDVLAPSVEKQAKGWIEENPPHEWFNWHMRRTDTRLNELEEPIGHVILDLPAAKRDRNIKKGERFNLPAPYVVGTGQLHVYLDGILCRAGEEEQYVECGQEYAESDYIRWNDEIPADLDIRVEIPLRSREPAIYADEQVVGDVRNLRERVARLEEPLFSARLDSPAGTRPEIVRAGDIFTFEGEYVVGSNQLQVFKNGILLYAGADYDEMGVIGEKASDIVFLKDVQISDNIRAYIATRDGGDYHIVAGASSLKSLEDKIAEITEQNRRDELVAVRIEAPADYDVPPYHPGKNELRVYKNGRLLVPNRDYSENADDGEISTRIIWNASVDANTLITAVAPARVALEQE